VLERAMAMARSFAQGSPQALAMTKLFTNQSLESDYATMARLEGTGQAACLNSDYFFEAVARFMDRKPPRFNWPY
jgi:2-(1,2-epoxy-1,2-dihydrophenyl)acetyl-CoA isomerase